MLKHALAAIFTVFASTQLCAQDFGELKAAGEREISRKLIDPSSAQFEWPYGFVFSSWKPFLQKTVTGWMTCGYVNAKNRMGGYVGRTAFIIVMNGDASVFYSELGTGGQFDITAMACQKSAKNFPPPQPAMAASKADQAPVSQVTSIADEIEKLNTLRLKGIITDTEFEQQKAKLLAK